MPRIRLKPQEDPIPEVDPDRETAGAVF
jgi:hypothetical protein